MDLTIAQLAERTGVAAGTLRMWESRYAFPRPTRLPSGHRRYHEHDVDLVQQVVRHRGEGLSLAAAIERIRRQQQRLPASIFAGLRERRPELMPVVLRKPAVLAISRAIEDERCASAATGLILGSFQRVRFYRDVQRRWEDVARTAEVAVAMADFDDVFDEPGRPVEVPLAPDEALAREWTLVSEAPEARGCVAAWEVPSGEEVPDHRRRFETLFSCEPDVVRVAVEVAADVVATRALDVAERIRAAASDPVRPSVPELRAASALTQRMIGYLGRAAA